MALYDLVIYTDSVSYAAVTAWATATIKQCGNLIRATAPAVGSERVFVCIHSSGATSQTAGVEPTWGTTRGALTLDNTNLTWQECTGIAGVNGDISTNNPTWTQYKAQTATATLGQVIQSGDGSKILICCTGGAMGAAEPSWTAFSLTGANSSDSGATWVTIGTVSGGVPTFAVWGAVHARIKAALAANWGAAGNFFYVASSHAESQGAGITWTLPAGSHTNPVKIVSTPKTVAPPTTAATGATVTCTGGNFIDSGTGNVSAYFYGLTIKGGSGASAVVAFGDTIAYMTMHYELCNFVLLGPSSNVEYFSMDTNPNTDGGVKSYRFTNCTWVMNGNTGSGFYSQNSQNASWNIVGGSISNSGGTAAIANLFGALSSRSAPQSNLTLRSVDMTALFSGTGLFSGSSSNCTITFINCGLPANYVWTTGFSTDSPGAQMFLLRSDSSGTNYNMKKVDNYGNMLVDTELVRSGGANDNGTPISWKFVTNNSQFLSQWPEGAFAIRADPLFTWNSATGQDITMSIYGIWKGAATPKNSDIDIEVQYLGSTSSPLGSRVSSNRANPITANAALSGDTASTWGQTGSNQVPAYQTAHAYGSYTDFILAGDAVPQQVWFMSGHSGSGTSGNSAAIFNGKADGATVTDNSGANQIVWQAMTRFVMTVTCTAPQVQSIGAMYTRIRAYLNSTNFWTDPLTVKSPVG
jgi:hypothetical protein